MILHAGLIALRCGRYWRGALITGASGAGKSDLALRALDFDFRLVADDRVAVWTSGGHLYGRCPETIEGLIEARGVGVLPAATLEFCRIALVVDCGGATDRLPEPEQENLLGAVVPRIRLSPLEASAPAKLGRALLHLGDRA
ncbi:HPr kinase/phosphorylase [soil metagenome]